MAAGTIKMQSFSDFNIFAKFPKDPSVSVTVASSCPLLTLSATLNKHYSGFPYTQALHHPGGDPFSDKPLAYRSPFFPFIAFKLSY